MRRLGTSLPLVLRVSDGDPGRARWLTDDGLRGVRAFADDIGPAKGLLLADRSLTARAHAARPPRS